MEEIISALKKILVFLLNRPKIILVGLVLPEAFRVLGIRVDINGIAQELFLR